MSTSFDIELFLAGVLTGSHSTRQRHLRQAKAIQAAISNRWHKDNLWTWQRKHLAWYLNHYLNQHTEPTRYYYMRTVRLLTLRLGKDWQFKQKINDGFLKNQPMEAVKNPPKRPLGSRINKA